jgi:hypothetical protein
MVSGRWSIDFVFESAYDRVNQEIGNVSRNDVVWRLRVIVSTHKAQ